MGTACFPGLSRQIERGLFYWPSWAPHRYSTRERSPGQNKGSGNLWVLSHPHEAPWASGRLLSPRRCDDHTKGAGIASDSSGRHLPRESRRRAKQRAERPNAPFLPRFPSEFRPRAWPGGDESQSLNLLVRRGDVTFTSQERHLESRLPFSFLSFIGQTFPASLTVIRAQGTKD